MNFDVFFGTIVAVPPAIPFYILPSFSENKSPSPPFPLNGMIEPKAEVGSLSDKSIGLIRCFLLLFNN
jgi:hypothetical protein